MNTTWELYLPCGCLCAMNKPKGRKNKTHVNIKYKFFILALVIKTT